MLIKMSYINTNGYDIRATLKGTIRLCNNSISHLLQQQNEIVT